MSDFWKDYEPEPSKTAPVQEPVAWAMYQRGRLQSFWLDKGDAYDFEFTSEHEWKPLYTTPPAQPAPVQEPVAWTPGPNLFKDWCCQYFGPDVDDAYIAHAIFNLPPMAQRFAATPPAQPAPVHFAWMRYEADCAGDPVLVLARSTEEGAFKVYKEPPAAQPAPVQEPVARIAELEETVRQLNHALREATETPTFMGEPVISEPAAKIKGVDEYGPLLDWTEHWVNFPVGTKLYTTPSAQPAPVQEPSFSEGWERRKVIGFDALVEALDYAERKGFMPDYIADAWEGFNYLVDEKHTPPAAQPAVQEPFGYLEIDDIESQREYPNNCRNVNLWHEGGEGMAAIYTTPPAQPAPAPGYCKHCKQYSIEEPLPAAQRQWVGLTPDEYRQLEKETTVNGYNGDYCPAWDLIEAVEAKLKEKNNG